MKLQLDVAALEALFPEGSEARVALQQCVMEEFSRRYIKTIANSETIRKIMEGETKEVKEAIAKATEEVWGKRVQNGHNSFRIELSPEVKKLVVQAATNAVDDVIEGMIRDQIKLRVDRLDQHIEAKMKAMNDRVDELVRKGVNGKVGEYIEQEVNRRLQVVMLGIRNQLPADQDWGEPT